MTTYDYIIVGAGSAGCVLANRLSADVSKTVCLLEAGPEDTHPLIHMPIGILWLMMSRKLNWKYYTQPQVHLNQRRLYWPRGKMLGGSSSSNAMCYSRGHPTDYDQWAALGNKGWGYADVLPLFKRSENHERGASEYHGVGGPLNVADLRSPNLLGRVFLNAAVQVGFPENMDFSGAWQEGVGPYQVTQKDGERWSMARGYLRPVIGRANLTVITGARAARIMLKDKRATGVLFVKDGKEIEIGAAREVILSGGAINSPQLLLLSGIGPQDELKKLGIAAAHHLPGVGKNLQDHLDALIVHKCSKPVSLGVSLRNLPHQLKHLFDYLRWKKGPLTTNGAEAGGFVKSDSRPAVPDLQLHFTPVHLDGHARDASHAAATMLGHGFALHVCQLRPNSRGQITLASADPLVDALIQPDYLGDPADMEAMVVGVKLARRILAAPAFDQYRGEEMQPGKHVQSDDEIKEFVRRKAETIYHPVGTCKMGHDTMAVVNDRLKVHGIDGLRVVDASIMPTLIGGNTNAPTVMIAEKAADMILAGALEAASESAATSAAHRLPASTQAIA
jgi:choline dehydrogenase